VIGRDEQAARLGRDIVDDHALVGEGAPDERHVEAPAEERVRGAADLAQDHPGIGVAVAERRDDRPGQLPESVPGDPDPQDVLRRGRRDPVHRSHALDAHEDVPGAGEQLGAGVRELDAAGCALEEDGSELALEAADGLRERRL
jgi:hypothetical protein